MEKLKLPEFNQCNFLEFYYEEVIFDEEKTEIPQKKRHLIKSTLLSLLILNIIFVITYIVIVHNYKHDFVKFLILLILIIDAVNIFLLLKNIKDIYYDFFKICANCFGENILDDTSSSHVFFYCKRCKKYYKIERERES